MSNHVILLKIGYLRYGLNVDGEEIVYREYAPGAKSVFLTGDFNSWNRKEHPLQADSFGNWEIRLPLRNKEGNLTIGVDSRVKAHVCTH